MSPRTPGRPVRVAAPATFDELDAEVDRAESEGLRIRPVGGGHSFSRILAAEGLALRTDRLVGLLPLWSGRKPRVDPEALVQVACGTRVRALTAALARRGRALENTAAFTDQTVVGALATASHGTGLALPPMCDQAVSVLLRTGGGRWVRVEPRDGPTDPARYDETELLIDDDAFYGALTGLGGLGVVAAVTLRTLPAYALSESRTFRPLGETLDALDRTDLLTRRRHLQVLANPHPSRPHCVVTERDLVDAVRVPDRLRFRQRLVPVVFSRLGLSRQLIDRFNRHPEAVPRWIDRGIASTARGPITGRAHRILDNWPLNVCAPAHALEWFVPLPRWREAMDTLLALASVRASAGEPLTAPISIRFVGASRHLFAPSYLGPGAMIEVVQLAGARGGRESLVPYGEALARFGGRPHVGLDLLSALPSYPELDRWWAARARLEPGRSFDHPLFPARPCGSAGRDNPPQPVVRLRPAAL